MVNKRSGSTLDVSRFIILISCLVVVLMLGVAAIVSSMSPEKPISAKEEIADNISNFDSEKQTFRYAASYLEELGIRGFDTRKFKTCEDFFNRYSIYEIRPAWELSLETAELFLKYFYDKINLDDKTALTDSLIVCYVEAFGDKYAVYRTEDQFSDYKEDMSGSFTGIGVTVSYDPDTNEINVISVMDDSAAKDAGILAGDKIHAVDGVSISDVSYEELLSSIRGEVGEHLEITLIRDGKHITVTAVRKQIVEKSVTYSIDDGKIGYVKITGFKKNTAEQFKEAIDFLEENCAKGIIFDLRDNPGGYFDTVVDVIDYLVPDGTRIASYNKSNRETIFTAEDGHHIDIPSAVIFNGNTASAGELFSAAMKDFDDMGILKSVSIGERTYSKGVMQSTEYFSDGSALTLTIAYYNPPSDVNYDGVGISPDVEVKDEGATDMPLAEAYIEISKLIQTN